MSVIFEDFSKISDKNLNTKLQETNVTNCTVKGYIFQQQLIYSVSIEYLLCDKHDDHTEGKKDLFIMPALFLEEFHLKIW